MQPWLIPYVPTVLAMTAIGGLFLVQLLVLDFAGIRARHVPGTPIAADHGSFLFRATRAHANTNESIAAFVLLTLVALLASAAPAWTNGCAWLYVMARLGHMLCYYADLRLARSVAFAVGLVALIVLFVVVVAALL